MLLTRICVLLAFLAVTLVIVASMAKPAHPAPGIGAKAAKVTKGGPIAVSSKAL